MVSDVFMIGLEAGELEWVRLLVSLLRTRDPAVVELVQQALVYVDRRSHRPAPILAGRTIFRAGQPPAYPA